MKGEEIGERDKNSSLIKPLTRAVVPNIPNSVTL